MRFLLFNIFLLFFCKFSSSQNIIVYPKNNLFISDTLVSLKWNNINNAEQYNIQVSKNINFNNILVDTITTNNNINIKLNFNKYYWRVNYFDGNDYSVWAVDSFTIFSPSIITNLKAWYSCDKGVVVDSNNNVFSWNDISSNNNLNQFDTSSCPKYTYSEKIENTKVILFDGENDFLKSSTFNIVQPYNIIILFNNLNNLPTNQYIYDGYSLNTGNFSIANNRFLLYSNSFFWSSNNVAKDKYNLVSNTVNNANSIIRENSLVVGNGDPGDANLDGLTIGSYGLETSNPERYSNIECLEILVIDSTISIDTLFLIEQYIRHKYAPPANLGYNIHIPYGFCDTTIDAGARFTNYLWSTGDTTQTITVNQPGQYSVTVTDIFGFESSDSLMVYYPEINQQLADTLICFGDTIKWNAGLQDTNYIFLWQNSETDSIHSIFSAGDYYVQITDTFGCIYHSDTAQITIDNYPITTSLGNDTSLCAGQNLYLQVGASETVNYLWNTGSTNDNITINSADDYSVTATNTIGCVATDTINIQIHGNAPVVGFDYANLCFNDNTVFTDTSYTTDNSNIISWNWNFSNGDTSILQNPEIQFADTGIFSISLNILTDSNCTNLLVKDIEIHSLPVSDYTNTQLCQETNINFTNLSTIQKGNIVSYYWDFGNGDFSTDTNPSYSYTNYGYYDLQLISTSDFNCKDTLKQQIEIKPSPISDFLTSATCKDKVISFYNNSSSLPYNPVYETHWDFGDGTISDATNPNYLFYGSDTMYNVSLQIKSINGCWDSVVKQIQLYNNPKANFTNDKICAETYTQLTNNSSITNDTITSYVWQIDNNFYYEENPTVFFNQAGQTNISLTTTSTHGCTDNYQEYIPILELPNPDFDIVPQWGITNEYTVFTSQNEGDNFWNFGNGNTATDSISYTVYPDSGMYIIEHIVVDSNNCVDTIYKDYRVVIPQNDIAITEVRYTINNNILSVEADIINIGNLPVNKIKLTLSPDKYSSISETWEGELIYGSGMTYTFNANYTIFDNKTPEYICVTADITDKYTDTNPSDNTYCTDNNNIVLYPIYPNPCSDYINISFKLNSNSDVDISLYDNKGKLITDINNQNYEKGFHKLTYNISSLSKASYTIKININNNTETTKFIKN